MITAATLNRMIEMFPPLDFSWEEEVRNQWWECFRQLTALTEAITRSETERAQFDVNIARIESAQSGTKLSEMH